MLTKEMIVDSANLKQRSQLHKRGCIAVLQDWVQALYFMQQTVLLTAVRGPDGLPKYGAVKMLLRWFRRCTLVSAMDGKVLATPHELGGGSFTGPSIDVWYLKNELQQQRYAAMDAAQLRGEIPDEAEEATDAEGLAFAEQPGVWERHLDRHVEAYLRDLDMIPHHFQLHFLHAAEIVGYKHPDARIRAWWAKLYVRLVHDMHLYPESEAQMDSRLGDDRSGWLERADPATQS